MLVSGLKDYSNAYRVDRVIANHLNAIDYYSAGRVTYFALKLEQADSDEDDSSRKTTYVQLDVHPVRKERLAWTNFHNTYGDVFNILNSFARSLGFVFEDTGLWVRIPEIGEAGLKQLSMIFLNLDPVSMMTFFDLDVARYQAGFLSLETLFEWIYQNRFFFNPKAAGCRFQFHRLDRKLVYTRPMIKKFHEHFLPGRGLGFQQTKMDRQAALDHALDVFQCRDRYDAALTKFDHEQSEKDLFEVKLPQRVPLKGEQFNEFVRAVKRWAVPRPPTLCFDGRAPSFVSPTILKEARDSDTDEFVAMIGKDNVEELLGWIQGHWKTLRAREKWRIRENSAEVMEMRSQEMLISPAYMLGEDQAG